MIDLIRAWDITLAGWSMAETDKNPVYGPLEAVVWRVHY